MRRRRARRSERTPRPASLARRRLRGLPGAGPLPLRRRRRVGHRFGWAPPRLARPLQSRVRRRRRTIRTAGRVRCGRDRARSSRGLFATPARCYGRTGRSSQRLRWRRVGRCWGRGERTNAATCRSRSARVATLAALARRAPPRRRSTPAPSPRARLPPPCWSSISVGVQTRGVTRQLARGRRLGPGDPARTRIWAAAARAGPSSSTRTAGRPRPARIQGPDPSP
jgi:hypothetical protein